MSTSGYRGKGLEKAINKLFESYSSRGIHCQQNHPEQLFDGTMVKRHGFDFQILYQGKFYAFDAKECKYNKWPVDKAKMHQLKALIDVSNNGGEGFFLVYFTGLGKLVKFSAELIQAGITGGKKSFPPELGEETTINLLGIK